MRNRASARKEDAAMAETLGRCGEVCRGAEPLVYGGNNLAISVEVMRWIVTICRGYTSQTGDDTRTAVALVTLGLSAEAASNKRTAQAAQRPASRE